MNNEFRNTPKLYPEKRDCCGCGACFNICPQKAIHMTEDEFGFTYPNIDAVLCVKCGKCLSVCAYQHVKETNEPIAVYAAVSKNEEAMKHSASGGIFAALADRTIENNGVVFGAAFDDLWNVNHISVQSKNELLKLQGSKYTHSSTKTTFKEVEDYLKQGRKVLYSGTPCQIAGLKAFLQKEYISLCCVDIICHGVPSNRMLKEYIQSIEKQNGGKAIDFTFRDKKNGWGINGTVKFCNEGTIQQKKIRKSTSPYFYYFLKGYNYRENCYSCKYASKHRPADITLGDYWGIEKVHPDYIGQNGWNEQNGISVILINTDKGKRFLKDASDKIDLKVSDFEKASLRNGQLKKPTPVGKRSEILAVYLKGGWSALDRRFKSEIRLSRYSSLIKSLIPVPIKRLLKRIR